MWKKRGVSCWLFIRRRGNRVILSGDNVRVRKVQEADPVIINYLRSLFLEAKDETELKFETDEDKETPKKLIPKLETRRMVGIQRQLKDMQRFCWRSSAEVRAASLTSATNHHKSQPGFVEIGQHTSTQHHQTLKPILMLSWPIGDLQVLWPIHSKI